MDQEAVLEDLDAIEPCLGDRSKFLLEVAADRHLCYRGFREPAREDEAYLCADQP